MDSSEQTLNFSHSYSSVFPGIRLHKHPEVTKEEIRETVREWYGSANIEREGQTPIKSRVKAFPGVRLYLDPEAIEVEIEMTICEWYGRNIWSIESFNSENQLGMIPRNADQKIQDIEGTINDWLGTDWQTVDETRDPSRSTRSQGLDCWRIRTISESSARLSLKREKRSDAFPGIPLHKSESVIQNEILRTVEDWWGGEE